MEHNNNDGRKWAKAYTDSMRCLVNLNLTQREYKVLFYFFSLISNNNRLIAISQKEMSKDLNMAQSNVCNTFKSLEKKKIIIKQNGHLFINSDIIQFQDFNANVCMPNWKSDNNIKQNTRDKRIEKKEVVKNIDNNDLYTDEEKELFAEMEL